MQSLRKRILALATSLVMAFSLLPAVPLTAVAATSSATSSQFDSILNMDQQQPSEFDPTSTENPYGYAVDQPFLMNEMSELGVYGITGNGNNKSFWWYDGWKGESANLFGSFGADSSGSFNSAGSYSNMKALSFVESVAFDPNGTGRKDHIAYIGLDTTEKRIVLYVQNAEDGTGQIAHYFPVSASWFQKNNNNPQNWRAGNYFAITAGDYDGDGKETIVAFVTADSADDYGLYELQYEYSGAASIEEKSGKNLLHKRYVNENHGTTMANADSFLFKLCCDLATGDFNGDGVDDLAVVSYLNGAVIPHANYDCEYYIPMLAVSYGGTADSPVTDGGRQTVFLAEDNGISGGKRSYSTMSAVGLDAGDVDGDGTDEIVVGGPQNTVTSKANSADAETAYGLNGRYWNITILNARSDGGFANPGTDDSLTQFHTVQSTDWYYEGDGGQTSRSPLSVACVAFNGSVNAEYVFVGGKIIDFSAGNANELHTVSFVKNEENTVGRTKCDITFIPSVAVGNFDGNDYGYEQIFFVFANREDTEMSNDDDYFYRLGFVGGTNYDGEGGGVGSAAGTDQAMFYEKSGGRFMGAAGTTGQGGAGAEGHWEYNTNFVLVAMDRDTDGVMARYKGKEWSYTDPQVTAVLQMAPYFDEIDLGSDSGETTYTFTQSYEYTTGSGNEVSFGVGFTGEVETPAAKVALQAGSSSTWTETFEETLTYSTTDSFATKAYDSVVLQRTPVITYTYEIYDAEKGDWVWDDLDSKEDGTGFSVSVPKTPVYVQMSVTDYDAFVDEYNAKVDEMAEEYQKETGQTIDTTKMGKISGQKTYLGQEGNPWGYADSLTRISSSTYQLGYNGGETQSSNSTGTAYTQAFESSYGFSFEMSVMAGFKIGNNGAFAGAYASLEYMHSSSNSTTTASETETSGAVQNLDWPYLLEEYGIPQNVTESYGFTWSLAKDTISLGVAGSNVPVIAYNVSNITAPAPSVGDLTAELVGLDSVHLTWSKPEIGERPDVTGYHVYAKSEDDDGYIKVTETALSADATEYTVAGLDSNTEYTFVVTTTSENGESVWSNEAVITTPKASVPLTMEYNTNEVSVTATHLGNVKIQSGDNVEEDTIVYVDVEPQPGYAVTEVTLTTEDGTQTVTPVDGQFNFAIQKATTITVTAAVVAEESYVSYTAEYDNGSVSATVNGQPFVSTGATFSSSDEIVFAATPADGYALKEWSVTDGSDTVKTYAAAGNTFTFHSYAATHHVSAVFVPLNEVAKTVTLNIAGGGSIVVKDGDTTLTPDADGALAVPAGTTLTFEAVADPYYTFENWTDAFAGYQNDTTSISLKIDSDVAVGAVFEPFLAYTLSYGTKNVDGGSGTLTATANGSAIQSGAKLTPDTTVDFEAVAGTDSRIQKWEITENGITSFKDLNQLGIVTNDAYQLIMQANSDVDAYFKTVETYNLTGTAFDENGGTVTVARADGTAVSAGTDVLRYYDDLTITLTPNKGYVITRYPDLEGTDTYSYTVNDVTADVNVDYAWKALEQYNVTYSVVDTVGDGSGTHGTVSAKAERKGMDLYADSAPGVVYEGGTITFTAAPDPGYRVKEWKVNGEIQAETGNTLTLTPMENLTVTVQYSSGLPKVSFADPAHGTLTAKMGEYDIRTGAAVSAPVTFTVAPDENYEVKCWTVNGAEQSGETGNTFTYDVTNDCAVAVVLQGEAQDVKVNAGTGGTASATDPARYGETITVTATPDAGYVVDIIKVSGVDTALYENTSKENGVQTATYEITGDTTFDVTFSKKPVVTFSVANGNLTACGTVDGKDSTALTNGGYVDFGSAVSFTAAPNSGYALEGWYVDGEKIEQTDLAYTTDALSEDVTVEARFAAIADIQVSYAVNGDDMGTITASADGNVFQSGYTLFGGKEIVFTVTPKEGYRMAGWSGLPNDAVISTDKTTATVPALANTLDVTANLEAIPQYTVTLDETTHGSISVTVDGKPLASGATVPDGTEVTFTATPNAYWMFKEWTGDASGTSTTVTLTVNGDVTVGATFTEALLYEVSYSVTGENGAVSGTCEGTSFRSGPTSQFAGGSKLEFTATPNSGYMVKEWKINDTTVEGNLSNALTIDALSESSAVTVEFEEYQGFALPTDGDDYMVTDVQRTPAETYSGAPDNEIRKGGDVTFTVVPEEGKALKAVKVAREDATITPNGDGSMTVFIPNVQEGINLEVEVSTGGIALAIGTAENGSVIVMRDGVALMNGVKVFPGDELTITATPNSGYQLDSLTVNGEPFASGSTFTVSEEDTEITVAATFKAIPSKPDPDPDPDPAPGPDPDPVRPGPTPGGTTTYAVSVSPDVVGGTVTVNPRSASEGTTVTITATPDEGKELASLVATDVSGNEVALTKNADGTWSFTMPASRVTVLATFVCDGGALCPSARFSDVDRSQWHHLVIDWAVENDILHGYDGTSLMGPGDPVTRAQMAAILFNAEGAEAGDASSLAKFADADPSAWYAGALSWAVGQGLFEGWDDGGASYVDPDGELTREQAAAVLMRWAEREGEDTSARADLSSFPDAASVSDWAQGCVSWAVAAGVINGVEHADGTRTLDPLGTSTRAQTAALMMNLLTAE